MVSRPKAALHTIAMRSDTLILGNLTWMQRSLFCTAVDIGVT